MIRHVGYIFHYVAGMCFFFFLLLFLPSISKAQPLDPDLDWPNLNWARGPIPLEDQHSLSIPRLTFFSESPRVLGEGNLELGTKFALSNSINRKGTEFIVDSEDRVFTASAKFGITKNLEIGFWLPLVWRGEGVFDSFFFKWHDFFGLPQGPRDDRDIRNDTYDISGETDSGDLFLLNRKGLYLGDLRLGSKYLITPGSEKLPAIAASVSMRLPTGANQYGTNGVDIMFQLLASKRISPIVIYSGAGYSYFSSVGFEGFEYKRNRYSGFISGELEVSGKLSLIFGVNVSSNLISNIARFPKYQVYMDTGLKYGISDSVELELLVRENPGPENGTSDFSGLVGLKYKNVSSK